jgi:hypothetical protein
VGIEWIDLHRLLSGCGQRNINAAILR